MRESIDVNLDDVLEKPNSDKPKMLRTNDDSKFRPEAISEATAVAEVRDQLEKVLGFTELHPDVVE